MADNLPLCNSARSCIALSQKPKTFKLSFLDDIFGTLRCSLHALYFVCAVTELIQAARQTEEKSASFKTTLLNQLSVKIAQLNHNLEPRCHGFGLDPQLAAYSLVCLFIPQDKTGINITCV